MSKKVFTLLLLAVFVLAQFSMASAAPAPVLASGVATVIVDTFTNDRLPAADVQVNLTYTWQGANLTAFPASQVLIWARERVPNTPASLYTCIQASGVLLTANGNGSFSDATTPAGVPVSLATLPGVPTLNGDDYQFVATIDDDPAGCAGTPEQPGVLAIPSDATTIDLIAPDGYIAAAPSSNPAATLLAACNTFELYGLVQDIDWTLGQDYSGVKKFGEFSTITSSSPAFTAAIGLDWMDLAWDVSIPSTATAVSWSANPSDVAGNKSGLDVFYTSPAVTSGEKSACKNFSDVAGLDSEAIIRYMADIKLIGGYADGTFGPDNVLTRAELATLIEISNGYEAGTLPTAAPAGCSFSDVSSTDWFAGWIWQACADKFLAGYADGSYGPNDTLTRAHVVTALDNVFYSTVTLGGYFNPLAYATVLESAWTSYIRIPATLTGEFSDVEDNAAYYYDPAYSAFGAGIADATDADFTTFSPDAPVTRAEFVTMLYRALSQYNAVP